jgi:polyhydroxybutyrate depolymerase
MRTAKSRRGVIGAVLVLISLPMALALVEAVAFFVSNRSNGSFVSSGEKRDYLLYVPKSYDRTKPAPLVISLHAAAMWGAAQKETSQWNRVADSAGFIVVYPSGVRGNGPRIWREDDGPGLGKDAKFIAELIDTLEAAYKIDPTRIYANGLSNGGGMSFALSCTMSNRIAAVGLVGSAQLLP